MTLRYRLTFRGQYRPERDMQAILTQVAALFGTTPDRVQALLGTLPAIIKKNLSPAEGRRYQQALTEAGLITHLEPAHLPLDTEWNGQERRHQDRRFHRDRRANRRDFAIQPDRRKAPDRRHTPSEES